MLFILKTSETWGYRVFCLWVDAPPLGEIVVPCYGLFPVLRVWALCSASVPCSLLFFMAWHTFRGTVRVGTKCPLDSPITVQVLGPFA